MMRVSGTSPPAMFCELHAPACVTDTARPAIVAVPVRCAAVLAARVSVTVPLPDPLVGLTEMNPLADAVQFDGEHPEGDAVTVTVTVLDADGNGPTVVGVTVKTHGTD
jgi:hypothetical protein